MTNCRECKNPVSQTAETCPKCGCDQPTKSHEVYNTITPEEAYLMYGSGGKDGDMSFGRKILGVLILIFWIWMIAGWLS
jgi:hypothetical protein